MNESHPSKDWASEELEGLVYEDGELTENAEGVLELAMKLLAESAHRNARSKGWYENGRKFPEEIALVHSEASEALEAYRDGHGMDEHFYSVSSKDNQNGNHDRLWADPEATLPTTYAGYEQLGIVAKPCGIPSESADILIRVGDYCGNPERPVDLGRAVIEKLRFNRTRPARHGGKKA